MAFVRPGSSEARQILDDSARMAQHRRNAVSNNWMKNTLSACGLVSPNDVALAIDCRDFHDPQRHADREKARQRSGPREPNHIGFHHTVFAGLLRGGAMVYNQSTHEKEHLPLVDWWRHFVLSPLWNKTQQFVDTLRRWEQQNEKNRGAKPRLAVVFFCNYGRHRSVALQKAFLFLVQQFEWARLVDASHLSSHSWKFVTCDCCEVAPKFYT
jgi:hypothetical protein